MRRCFINLAKKCKKEYYSCGAWSRSLSRPTKLWGVLLGLRPAFPTRFCGLWDHIPPTPFVLFFRNGPVAHGEHPSSHLGRNFSKSASLLIAVGSTPTGVIS